MNDKEPPSDWQPEAEEIRRRRQLAARMGGEESVARHHAAGKLTVRERVERLLDSGSFQELGSLAGSAEYEGDDRMRLGGHGGTGEQGRQQQGIGLPPLEPAEKSPEGHQLEEAHPTST